MSAESGGGSGHRPLSQLQKTLAAGALTILAAGGWLIFHYGGFQPAIEQVKSSIFGEQGRVARVDDQALRRTSTASNVPIAVEVAPARSAKTSSDIRAVGSLQSDESVQIAPEISGRISAIVFSEGKPVKKGDVLVKLDDALAAAEVADAQARLTLASANNDRARTLSKTGNVTGRGRDEATANFETAQAAAELAKTRLSKHVLTAPFGGIAGVRNVSAGAFVNAGTAITNLEKIDTLKVDFKVSEIFLEAVKVDQAVELTVDAIPDRTFAAKIYAINPMLDVNGRALEVRARLDNAELRLRPGLFARITIKGLSQRDVVLVPEAAVLPRGGEAFLYVVDNDKVVEKRVKLGQRANAEVEILDGLDAKAIVVVAGQQKLRDGASIEVVPGGSDAVRSGVIKPERASQSRRSG